jgi:hypothetical protein
VFEARPHSAVKLRRTRGAPLSIESKFCVVPGDRNDRIMLERIGSNVVSATEALAVEESRQLISPGYCNCFSVIVTTAALVACLIDPGSIDIANGTIETHKCVLKPVEFLRFTKQLSGGEHRPMSESHSIRPHRGREQTVFIVNSSGLKKFLSEFDY